MSIQWPTVAAHLLQVLPALPGWSEVPVYDGVRNVSDAPQGYATVGYGSESNAGNYVTQQTPDGFRRQETGTVIVEIVTVSPDGDVADVRNRLFGLLDAFDTYIRNTRTLTGTLSDEGTVDLTVDLQPVSNRAGTALTAVASVNYTTVT